MTMKKAWLFTAALLAAAGTLYLSRTGAPPQNEQVRGALVGPRLARGATICVGKIQSLSEKQAKMEGLEDQLVAQLRRAGFAARLATPDAASAAACEATVFGELVSLRGKDRMEAQVEFRVLIAGEEAPFMSSIAKGKSSGTAAPALPGNSLLASKKAPAAVQQEAIAAALADVAKQVEAQRPSRPTRAVLE
jgi:hypothetical protein